jgi:hypothetical protein
MKNVFVVMFSLMVCGAAFAQEGKAFYNTPYKSRNSGSFGRTASLLTFSYGFPNEAVSGYSHKGYNRIGFGPVYAKYEHGIADEFGLGGQIALAGVRYDYDNNQTERVRAFHFAFLGYYHFNKLIPVKQLDVYAGAGPSFRSRTVTYSDDVYDNYSGTDVDLAVKVGARYYVKNNFAFYGEGGFDRMSDINLGITLRL